MCLIHNPQAGRGKAAAAFARLRAALARAGLEPEVRGTQGRGHAEELAREAVERGVETVIVVGGDGTVHEAAQALAHSDAVLAPLPCGRCNDFCRALGAGRDPEALVRALAGGGRRVVDLARVNDRVYCTVGAVGFDAVVSRYVDTMKAPLWGTPAYLYAVMRMITRYQPPQASVVWDDGEYHGPLFLVALGNTPSYGNNIRVTPPRPARRRPAGHLPGHSAQPAQDHGRVAPGPQGQAWLGGRGQFPARQPGGAQLRPPHGAVGRRRAVAGSPLSVEILPAPCR